MEVTIDFLQSALQTMKRDILSSLHVAMPGTVVAYDTSAHTADVQPVLQQTASTGEIQTAPLLRSVPVFIPFDGFTVSPGNHCLLIFADFCIDGWFASGEPALPPAARAHDLADAFAIVGFYPKS